ncbi:MAG: hypothetical protein JXA03_14260 [Bacteroidales bacterium]|nr:hypothetical protein [Bacteroidales bacterium]
MDTISRMHELWNLLYGETSPDLLETLISEAKEVKIKIIFPEENREWYKTAVVYSLYVDLFNHDFCGLSEKLDYLQDLGINCIWLLPVLDSPMRDAGFDISDYRKIRPDLLECSNLGQKYFEMFLNEARQRNLRVIFDIAINHTSEEHPWFKESKKSDDNPFRDYYIWSKTDDLYKDARIIFKGLCSSNWEKYGDWYYFHRFFEFQPDLNYKNPLVLVEMCRNFLYWLEKGVNGFRADAIPYLWKEEGTSCENLPQTHTVVKFFRALMDEVRPGTLLLAEACQRPDEVVKYFGEGDECNAGYHFPLMPQMFKSIASRSVTPVREILSKKATPEIPENAQWFTFLRCHDELSLELVYVSEEDRKYIHDSYCKHPQWDFREGQGISARLAELMDRNPARIHLAFSVMLTLPGTPIVYYGDEFGKLNDEDYYYEMIKLTGKDDTRFLVRGKINWEKAMKETETAGSFSSEIFHTLKKMLNTRNRFESFGKGNIRWLTVRNLRGGTKNSVMAFIRSYRQEKILVLNNLSEEQQSIYFPGSEDLPAMDLFGHTTDRCETWEYLRIPGLSWFWYTLK